MSAIFRNRRTPKKYPLHLSCWLALCLSMCAAYGCGLAPSPPGIAPLPLAAEAVPPFSDDLYYEHLEISLKESVTYLDTLPPERRFTMAGHTVSVSRLQKTLSAFLKIVQEKPKASALNQAIQEQFLVYRVPPVPRDAESEADGARSLLLTGYFQPLFQGSLQRKFPYIHPLYAKPEALIQRKTGQGLVSGRLNAAGQLIPFWSRREIEQGNLLAGSELAWLKDPFDAFLIHIQGSALIQLKDDSSIRALRFAAKNGRSYTSIGAYLVKTGRMRLDEVSMVSLRRYLETHPHEREQILHQNDSYIFFKWGEAGPVYGSLNRPLTAGRSVAADQKLYPPGLLAFISSSIPELENGKITTRKPLQRFVTVQDSGSAIQGPHRLDLFCGTGDLAGAIAGEMREKGELYLFLIKEE